MNHLKTFNEMNEGAGTHIISLGNTIINNLSDVQNKISDENQKKQINFIKQLVWKFKEGERHITEEDLDELYDEIVFQH